MRKPRFDIVGIMCILSIAAAMCLVSCAEKKDAFEPAPFAVNQDMIAAALDIPELTLSFSPPVGWNMLDSAQLDMFRRMVGGTDLSREFYPIFPIVVFADSVSGGMMYIAQIDETETPLSQISRRYDDFLTPRLASSAMTKTNYIINDLKVYYYLLHSTRTVNYKLIGETSAGKRFLIEYVMPGPTYVTLEPAASSSMATLRSSTPISGNQ